jgi:hypothetical protein
LELSWPANTDRGLDIAAQRVSLLQNLEFGRRGALLTLAVAKEGNWDWPDTIAIAADPEWVPAAAMEVFASELLADGRKRHVFKISDGERTAARLRIQFQGEAAVYGRVRPPKLTISSMTVVDDWLVVTCNESQFECIPSQPVADAGGLSPRLASSAELIGGATPVATVNLKQVTDDWFLAVRPTTAASTLRERISVAVGRNRTRVNYRSDIVPQGKDRFTWSLNVPENLIVSELTACIDEAQVPLDWTRVGTKRLQINFLEPIETAFRLELHGSMSRQQASELAIPKIERANGAGGSQVIALYREDNVAAEWKFDSDAPWVESGASLESPFDDQPRFVRAFSLDPARPRKPGLP